MGIRRQSLLDIKFLIEEQLFSGRCPRFIPRAFFLNKGRTLMILTYSAIASLTGINIKTIISGNYQPQELAKVWFVEYCARHYDEMRAAAADTAEYDHDTSILSFFLSYAKEKKSDARHLTLKVADKELNGKYGYWENPTTLYISANPPARNAFTFIYESGAQTLQNTVSPRAKIIKINE
jgi:chloramphenicol O-acetyltransferase